MMFSPLMFSPGESSTRTVGLSDNWSAELLVLLTVDPNPDLKVDELFVQPKNEHLYPKI